VSDADVIEVPRVRDPGSGVGGGWRVIVLNDDLNTFTHVADTQLAAGVCPFQISQYIKHKNKNAFRSETNERRHAKQLTYSPVNYCRQT